MRISVVLYLLIIFILSLNDVSATTYKSFVDQDYGFYRVISIDSSSNGSTSTNLSKINYTNKTLDINIGDTIIWINDADPDWPLTVINEDELWDNKSAYLRWNFQRFNYTFNKSGEYSFYLKENKKQRQIIRVNPIIVSTPTETFVAKITPIYTPTSTQVQISPTRTSESRDNNMIPGFTIFLGIAALLLISLVKEGEKK